MRPLPRVLAVTDDAVVRAEDFPIRAAAIAAAGSPVAVVVRTPSGSAGQQLAIVDRVRALAGPPEAGVIAHGDPVLGKLGRAHGIQLRDTDLGPGDARRVFGSGWVGVSVHSVEGAERARDEGADYVVAGNVFETSSHPERPARGIEWLRQIVATGVPVFAIGGITPARVPEILAAGAFGVAAIEALWRAPDSARAAEAMLAVWEDG